MARYSPTAGVKISKPCGERWEAMQGDSRVRHCDACGRDVINAASLTPEQIEGHIEAALNGAPMPCMRLVQFEDGSLMTARTERGLTPIQRAVAGVSALAVVATSAFAQQPTRAKDSTLAGRILDPAGQGVPGASVKLQQPGHTDIVVKSAAFGNFTIEAPAGEYSLSADLTGFRHVPARRVILRKGAQDLAQPLRLELTALMGEIVFVDRESATVKTENPKWEPTLR